jgi:glutaryl-CoA dehydrogenase
MPKIVESFENEKFPSELVSQMAKLGLFGADLDGYRCAGMSATAYGMACHELEACDSSLRSFVSVQTSLCMYSIYHFGTEDQKQYWLPAMASGKIISCFGLTEPNSGSDPSKIKTKAYKDGNHWVLSGSKAWITNAQLADIAIIWAKTGKDNSIQGFIVEKDCANFSSDKIFHKLSFRASSTGSLHLNEVKVPEANRIVKAVGLSAPLSCLNNARFSVAFGVLGAAYDCLERAIKYSKNRYQFGSPIAKKQLIQHKLAIMSTELTRSALSSIHFAKLKDSNKIHPAHVSLLKRSNCNIAIMIAREARIIFGANGIVNTSHILRHSLNLESIITYEGSEEIHSLIIGRYLTGEYAF